MLPFVVRFSTYKQIKHINLWRTWRGNLPQSKFLCECLFWSKIETQKAIASSLSKQGKTAVQCSCKMTFVSLWLFQEAELKSVQVSERKQIPKLLDQRPALKGTHCSCAAAPPPANEGAGSLAPWPPASVVWALPWSFPFAGKQVGQNSLFPRAVRLYKGATCTRESNLGIS